MILTCVPPQDVYKIWHGTVHDMIDAAFAASDMVMPPALLEQLRYGTRLLWLATTEEGEIVGALLTQLFDMRTSKICKMMECGGSRLHEWKGLREQIEQYAKAEGCDRVMVEGRVGWAAVLKDYRVTAVILEKRI